MLERIRLLRRRAPQIGLILASIIPASADVLPPAQPISDVQQALVGEWRQTAPWKLLGHGEGNDIIVFSKTDYARVTYIATKPSNIYELSTEHGHWTGKEVSSNTYEIAFDHGSGEAPDMHIIKIIGPTTIEFEKIHGEPGSMAPFERLSDD